MQEYLRHCIFGDHIAQQCALAMYMYMCWYVERGFYDHCVHNPMAGVIRTSGDSACGTNHRDFPLVLAV